MKISFDWLRRAPRRSGLTLLGISILLGFAWVVLRAGPLAPIQVTLATVETGTVNAALFGIGNVEARRAYLIGPTAAGRVLNVLVDVGESVKAGQLLAEMEPIDLEQRRQALAASTARAHSAVRAAEAQQQDALARQQLAQINAQRYLDLSAKKFVSPSAVEAKQQEQASAQAASQGAAANLASAQQEITRLQADSAGLNQQRANLQLRAPADGVITARDAEKGTTVVAAQAVIKMVDPSSLWIKLRLDQGRSAGLQVGLTAAIVRRVQPSTQLAGKVRRLELLSDSITEERLAQVAFDHIPPDLAVGEWVEVTLNLPSTHQGLLIPNACIKQHGHQQGVWRLQAGELQFVTVSVGSSSLDGKVHILSGLAAGDQVIVHSEQPLSANRRIKVVPALAGAAG